MKVLWFEVTEPSRYKAEGEPIGGWQDSLENIVRNCPEIELCIAFMSGNIYEGKKIDGVIYQPIYAKYSFITKIFKRKWDFFVAKLLPQAKKIINDFKPDIIHIFGTEWPFGQIVKLTKIPVVIHIQGAIVPYNNALYPPNYSVIDRIKQCGINPRKYFSLLMTIKDSQNREKWEIDTWNTVSYYMGRTEWDKALSNIMHPGRKYFQVEEALRPTFLDGKQKWKGKSNLKLRLISTGCSSFWKGPDMMLKVAKILKTSGIDFEWNVAGKMPDDIQQIVERKENAKFVDCNINIMGFIQSDKLVELLISSSIYVHTAYIENSPNSICEAQCLGVPIISTNVGGISTLVRNGENGILVPANDPWQMANAIMELSASQEKKEMYSNNGKRIAYTRHNPQNILSQLLNCYNTIIREYDKIS